MKIIFVTCAYPPYHGGGVSVILSNLSHELTQRGHEVFVFSIYDKKEKSPFGLEKFDFQGVTCTFINIPNSLSKFFHRYEKTDYKNLELAQVFNQYLSEIDPDIVHFHSIQSMGANLIDTAKAHSKSTIVTFHDFWWVCANLFLTDIHFGNCSKDCMNCHKQLANLQNSEYKTTKGFFSKRSEYLKEQLDKVDLVLANSKFVQKELSNWNFTKIKLNENGIIIPKPSLVKKANKKKIVFGFVGGKNDMKGYSIIKEAFMLLDRDDVELHIHGAYEKLSKKRFMTAMVQSIYHNRLMEAANSYLKLRKTKRVRESKQIHYFENYNEANKYKIFSSFDYIIVGSRIKESFSLVAREAQILNIPVITSDCGGPEDIVEEGINGYKYNRNSVNDLVRVLNSAILNHPLPSIKKIRIQSIQKQADELIDHYESLIYTYNSSIKK